MSVLLEMLSKKLHSADLVILQYPPLNLNFVASSDPSDPRLAPSSLCNIPLTIYRQMLISLLDEASQPTPQDVPLLLSVKIALLRLEIQQRIDRLHGFMKTCFEAITSSTPHGSPAMDLTPFYEPLRQYILSSTGPSTSLPPATSGIPSSSTASVAAMTAPVHSIGEPSGSALTVTAASSDVNNNNDNTMINLENTGILRHDHTAHARENPRDSANSASTMRAPVQPEPPALNRPRLNVFINAISPEAFLDLNHSYRFHSVTAGLPFTSPAERHPRYFRGCLLDILDGFTHFRTSDYATIARYHDKDAPVRRWTAIQWLSQLRAHSCITACDNIIYCFVPLKHSRPFDAQDSATSRHVERVSQATATPQISTLPYTAPSTELRNDIIKEWQAELCTENQKNGTCACCSRLFRAVTIDNISVDQIDFTLLQNNDLPAHVLPTSYNLAAYQNALLDPDGLSDTQEKKGTISLCKTCKKDLTAKEPQMPMFSLANWLYYGRDQLPDEIKEAFQSASLFEKSLISRARASRITFRYCQNPDSVEYGRSASTSQGYSKGNVIVMPQDSLSLNTSLPPTVDTVRDSMCVLFVGSSTAVPVEENIRKLSPVIVRKSRVATLIAFLTSNNQHYAVSEMFDGLSMENLDALATADTGPDQDFTPAAIEIAHLDPTSTLGELDVTSDYTNRNNADPHDNVDNTTDLLIENVGYTDGDDSPANYNLMKLRAVQHCLSGGSFVQSQTGSVAENDFENPSLLSWLFPHLDPWGIGGFHEKRRTRSLSMEQQLKYLVSLKDSPFATDPSFAFVYHNISLKKQTTRQSLFRVKKQQHIRVTEQLSATSPELLKQLEAKFERNPKYQPENDDEKRTVKLLSEIQSLNGRLPGSNGHKKKMRNEIRSLIHRLGPPSLFITINPADVNNPLVRMLAGEDINLEDAERGEDLSKYLRQKLVAKNPHIAAKYFDRVIQAFIKNVLRFGRSEPGLFGKCTGYYGVVEAQGKGTLHCHFLIWLDGHLSPQNLRDAMAADTNFKDRLFNYLESIIKSELPGDTDPVEERPGIILAAPVRARNVPNPAVIALPQCSQLSPNEFEQQFQRHVHDLVVENHWHRHNATCWKYLKRGEPKDDAHCRMRINGKTRATTDVDPDTGSILLRRLHPRINCHNDVLAFLTQSNNDIKFIGSGEAAKALVYYVTDYVTKTTLPTHVGLSAVRAALEKNQKRFDGDMFAMPASVSRSLFVKVANGILSRMEMSHQQVMSYIMGNADHYTGHKFQTLYWGGFDRAVAAYFESLDSQEVVDDSNVDPEGEVEAPPVGAGVVEEEEEVSEVTIQLGRSGITTNNQYDDYIYRSSNETFSTCSPYEFVQQFHKITKTRAERERAEDTSEQTPRARSVSGPFLPDHPGFKTHRLTTMRAEAVPVILGPTIPHPDKGPAAKEAWARAMLILFKPWRTPADLKEPHESWLEAYNRVNLSPELMQVVKNMLVLEECRDARDADMSTRRSRPLFDPVEGGPVGELERLEVSLELDDAQEIISREMERCGEADDGHKDEVDERALARALGVEFEMEVERPDLLRDDHTTLAIDSWEKDKLKGHAKLMARLKKKRGRDEIEEDDDEEEEDEEAEQQNRRKRRRTLPTTEATTLDANAEEQRRRNRRRTNDPRGNVLDTVCDVSRDFHLDSNPEQLRAFEIIAKRVVNGGEQLLMYVGGVGGTGKSHLIKAIVELFNRLGRAEELQLSAPTGAAAILIDGATIHSLTSLPNKQNVKADALAEIWRGKTFLVLDEVSMVGAGLLADISARINMGKGVEQSSRDCPFGAINVLFTGDFGQLKPVGERSLYSNELLGRVSASTAASARGQQELLGAAIWRQVTDIVILQENQRQREDPEFAELLGRVRSGTCIARQTTPDQPTDHSILSSRVLSRLSVNDPQISDLFADAPVIVGLKKIRDKTNKVLLRRAAKKAGRRVFNYHSVDRLRGQDLTEAAQQSVWNVASSVSKDALGILPLFHGMRVMITENVAIRNRLVNGMEGIVKHIDYDIDESNRRYAKACYVLVEGSGIQLEGFEPDVVPILPVQQSFTFKSQLGESFPISRLQLPLLPAYSYTDYKSQGRTLDRAIVDLKSARTLQGLYVMLSRVKSLQGLAVLHDFHPKKLEERLSEELRNEFKRFAKLDEETLERYQRLLRSDDGDEPMTEYDAMDT